MMTSEKLYEEIEQYLSGELKGNERKEFEARIAANPTLANEVRLHQELRTLMVVDKDEEAFRENLKVIDRETKIGSSNRLPALLFMGLMIAGLIWWMYPVSEEVVIESEETTEIIEEKQEKTTTEPKIEAEKQVIPAIKSEQKEPKKVEEKKETKISPIPKIEKPSQPIAMADYSTNPLLESLINNNRRSTEIAFTVDRQQADVKLYEKGSSLNFHIAGNAVGEEALSEGTYSLHIFSNQVEEYRNFLPKYTQELSFDKKEDNSLFEIKVGIALEPGLYYYLIEDSDTEELFFVEKFRVNL